MARAIFNIKRWGNNLGVRLPAAVAREANLHADQRAKVEVEAGRVIMTPVVAAAVTLEQRLARYDPARHGGDAMVSIAVGAEQCQPPPS